LRRAGQPSSIRHRGALLLTLVSASMKVSSRFRFHCGRVGHTLSLPMQVSTETI
jgi:hypothetical protein